MGVKVGLEEYDCIVACGVGQYYGKVRDKLKDEIKVNYLYDRRWEDGSEEKYDEIPIIRKKDIFNLKNTLLIIIPEISWAAESIRKDLEDTGFNIISINEVIENKMTITGKELKTICPTGIYKDFRGNVIEFDETISESIIIKFRGNNNQLNIGKNVMSNKLFISFGNNGKCIINKNTEVIGAYFSISEAKVEIGEDCLFSSDIKLRTHDSHHIFDLITQKRLNYAKDILIANQVWIGNSAVLLGGTEIGIGSVVGCNSLTKGKYGDHRIIAGVPAKVIRDNICWSRDSTDFYNHDQLKECISQDAVKWL